MIKIKEGENYNHRNTLKYFEDYNLSLTQRLGKIAILGQPPSTGCQVQPRLRYKSEIHCLRI